MFKLFTKRAPIFEILQYYAILSSDLVNKHYSQVMTNYIKGLIVQIRVTCTNSSHSVTNISIVCFRQRPATVYACVHHCCAHLDPVCSWHKCTSRFCGYVRKNYLTPRYQPCGKPVPDGLQIWFIQGRVYLCTIIKIIN